MARKRERESETESGVVARDTKRTKSTGKSKEPTRIGEHISSLFNNEQGSDMNFLIGTNTRIPAHKVSCAPVIFY